MCWPTGCGTGATLRILLALLMKLLAQNVLLRPGAHAQGCSVARRTSRAPIDCKVHVSFGQCARRFGLLNAPFPSTHFAFEAWLSGFAR